MENRCFISVYGLLLLVWLGRVSPWAFPSATSAGRTSCGRLEMGAGYAPVTRTDTPLQPARCSTSSTLRLGKAANIMTTIPAAWRPTSPAANFSAEETIISLGGGGGGGGWGLLKTMTVRTECASL